MLGSGFKGNVVERGLFFVLGEFGPLRYRLLSAGGLCGGQRCAFA